MTINSRLAAAAATVSIALPVIFLSAGAAIPVAAPASSLPGTHVAAATYGGWCDDPLCDQK